MICSVTEGDDKPLKYPHMSGSANGLLRRKTDLLPQLRVDLGRIVGNALKVNSRLQMFAVSACSGEGLAAWCGWLRDELARTRAVA